MELSERLEEIEMTGISTIGPCQEPTKKTRRELDLILKPMNMESQSLTWASNGEIDIIMGGDNDGLLVQDHPTMNSIMKPSNLRFYSSPVFELPLAFGEISGQWTDTVKNVIQENKPPDNLPRKKINQKTILNK